MKAVYSQNLVFPNKYHSEISDDGSVAKITIFPIQKGFGITVGNSFRRILLSSIQGSAFSNIAIENVLHEFTTISGIVEDINEIIFNLKSVILKSNIENGTGKINVVGPKKVKASDIKLPAGIKIINPDQYLFQINGNEKVDISLNFKSGIGDEFINLESGENNLGVINLDCHYSPVVNVSFNVTDTRVDKYTDYDKLVITIKTNGSISAEEAFIKSATIFNDFMNSMIDIKETYRSAVTDSNVNVDSGSESVNYNLFKKIDELELSVRSFNCLHNENVVYVGDIVNRNELAMLKTPNFGKKSLTEIRAVLNDLGLKFGMNIEWPPKNFKVMLEKAKAYFESERY